MADSLNKHIDADDLVTEDTQQEFLDWDIIIASNRGPIEHIEDEQGNIVQQKGSGGLITGLSGAVKYNDVTWISCAQTPHDVEFNEGYASLVDQDNDIHIKYIQVDPQTYDDYYNVIANPLIWFLQHSMWNVPSEPVIDHTTWKAWNEGYLTVNRLFADEITRQISKKDRKTLVMLQDYHLYMTAKYIRDKSFTNNQPTLLHFIHIPWPGPEYWHILPPKMRKAILDSLCGVDLLGFQTEEDGLNFIRTIESHLPLAHVSYDNMRIWYKNHATYIHDFPISIDVDSLSDMVHNETVIEHTHTLEETIGNKQLILRVDRIDPSKNIVRGFQAYQELLTLHPEYEGKVIFLAMLVPSRRGIDEYKDYLDKIMAVSGKINADFGKKDWEPVRILVGEDYERALAAMQLYDVLLVNAIADGMNLVAKEGPIINTKNGVLILSERAGASLQLAPGATIISPCDIYATAEAMHQGLSMDQVEKENRAKTLRSIIEQYDIHKWFFSQLHTVLKLNLQ
ncbi:MAG: trehalose-6-phosphate synthase [Chloroflexota bacterium]|jgi:trehalose 6-phosphate synthase|nr:trehalose-6-phosphate synthase [Chloroflexota bacterium]